MSIFVDDGDASATVERICAVAGVSPRTFHRHFPVKEDVVLPVLRAGTTAAAMAVRHAGVGRDLIDTLADALLVEVHGGALEERERAFLTIMATTPQYRTRWLSMDAELLAAVADLLQHHLPPTPDPLVTRLAPELVVTATRAALDHWVTAQPCESVGTLLRRGLRVALNGVLHLDDHFDDHVDGTTGLQ